MDINEVYDDFADQVQKLITFDRISLSLLDREDDTLTNTYVIGLEAEGVALARSFLCWTRRRKM